MQHLTTFDSFFFFGLIVFYILAGSIQSSLKVNEIKNESKILVFALVSILIGIAAVINSFLIIFRDPVLGTIAFSICAYVWPCFISLYVLKDFKTIRNYFKK